MPLAQRPKGLTPLGGAPISSGMTVRPPTTPFGLTRVPATSGQALDASTLIDKYRCYD